MGHMRLIIRRSWWYIAKKFGGRLFDFRNYYSNNIDGLLWCVEATRVDMSMWFFDCFPRLQINALDGGLQWNSAKVHSYISRQVNLCQDHFQ